MNYVLDSNRFITILQYYFHFRYTFYFILRETIITRVKLFWIICRVNCVTFNCLFTSFEIIKFATVANNFFLR